MAMRSKRGARGIVIAAVIAVVLLALSLTRFYTDVLWFGEVGFQSVLWKSLATQFAVGVVVGVVIGLVIWVNLVLASRIAPAYQIPRLEVIGRSDPLERYRETVGPYLRWLRLGVAIVIGLLAGAAASSAWPTFLLWANRVAFGETDPQFERDIGFYVFELPFLNQILSWAWVALLIALIGAAATHYLLGSIRPEGGLRGVASGALAHISVLLGLLALVKAGQYWLGTYSLNFSERGVVTGASYTDVNAHLPALRLLALISVVSAVLFLINIRVRRLSLPLAAVAIWIGFAFLAGGVWPWWVQRFSVEPQELEREDEFIARNIAATRAAFDIADVEAQEFEATSSLTDQQVRDNEPVLQNVRLWDPVILQQAYSQLQTIRSYYRFEDVDIDRYEIDGETRQVLVAPRELSLEDLQENSRTWSNLHLQYTHGYGLVASLANASTPAGQPEFLVKDVPGTVTAGAESLEVTGGDGGAALYFGEAFEPFEYSVVNTEQAELDYPTESGVQRSNYRGEGGIEVGNILRRAAFAIRERDPNLVLSGLISGDSRILIYRNVRERVRRVAPFLSLDHDPYVAVVDGRMQWILDAYTSTRFYPYSQRFDATAAIGAEETGSLSGDVNYVRNSVKVVVDAYDGSMTFYVVDENDPMIQAWSNAFPELFTFDAPGEELQSHFRYPEDLFDLQSDVYLTYHMRDPANFYAREDQWAIATSPRVETPLGEASTAEAPVPPTYLLVQLPGESEQEFVLTRPFTPNRRSNMIAFMAARSDPETYGELLTLEFPPDRLILGPSQIDQLVNQDEAISRTLTLLGQQGSDIEYGSLVTLPIEEAVLYIQPLFIRAESGGTVTSAGTGIPELKRVVIVFGEDVVIGNTFEQALAKIFGLDTRAPGTPPAGPGDQPPPEGGAPGGADARLARILERANQLYDQAQQALEAGDFERYGRFIERLGQVLKQAQALR
jgi:uncharacterized membrane protein (UPF0182 family)